MIIFFNTKYYLHRVQKNTFKIRFFISWQVTTIFFLFFYSCQSGEHHLKLLNKKLAIHQDSMKQVFFIPTKENLKSELTFYHELLSDLGKISVEKKDSFQVDSLKNVLKIQIKKSKGWTTDLGSYDLQKIIEQQFSTAVFLEKEYSREIPLFYKKGKAILKKEALANLDFHIQKQIEVYWFLKNEVSENQEAQIAVKDFIGFLNSIKIEQTRSPN